MGAKERSLRFCRELELVPANDSDADHARRKMTREEAAAT